MFVLVCFSPLPLSQAREEAREGEKFVGRSVSYSFVVVTLALLTPSHSSFHHRHLVFRVCVDEGGQVVPRGSLAGSILLP